MDLTAPSTILPGTLGEYWALLGEYWALLGEYWALLGEYWALLGEDIRVLGVVSNNYGRGFLFSTPKVSPCSPVQ